MNKILVLWGVFLVDLLVPFVPLSPLVVAVLALAHPATLARIGGYLIDAAERR